MGASGVRPENTFRYFCGIVWNIVRELQSVAADIVMADVAEEVDEAIAGECG
jgi:hypothetical protein